MPKAEKVIAFAVFYGFVAAIEAATVFTTSPDRKYSIGWSDQSGRHDFELYGPDGLRHPINYESLLRDEIDSFALGNLPRRNSFWLDNRFWITTICGPNIKDPGIGIVDIRRRELIFNRSFSAVTKNPHGLEWCFIKKRRSRRDAAWRHDGYRDVVGVIRMKVIEKRSDQNATTPDRLTQTAVMAGILITPPVFTPDGQKVCFIEVVEQVAKMTLLDAGNLKLLQQQRIDVPVRRADLDTVFPQTHFLARVATYAAGH